MDSKREQLSHSDHVRYTAGSLPGVDTHPVLVLDPIAACEPLLKRARREISEPDSDELARTLGIAEKAWAATSL